MQTWWNRAVDWVKDKLGLLLSRVGRQWGPGSPVFWILAVALGLALLGWLIRLILQVARAPSRVKPSGAVRAGGWAEWMVKAAACARRNEFREAIHFAYRAAVCHLEDAGLWSVDDARTPREYLRLMPGDDRHYAALEALTFRFERSWYGGRAASADEFRRTVAELEDLGCPFDWNPVTASS
jgi:hypothetical protein